MIRKDSFALESQSFAAERRKIMEDADARLAPHVRDALSRVGLPSWQNPIVAQALDLFDITARAEVDEWNPILDDLHDAFAKEISDALEKTKKAEPERFDAQVDTVTRWLSTAAHNAAMEAATTSDTDVQVGLEWLSMEDSAVRATHKEADGQIVPTGQPFSVGEVEMLYPGQPVGDPENWLNCRCVARPTMLSEGDGTFSANTVAWMAAEMAKPIKDEAPNPEESAENVSPAGFTSAVIVALPAESDPVSAASSEADGAHCTLLWLGDSSVLDRDALATALEQFVTEGEVGIITDKVSGSATLGKDKADVVLLDATNLKAIYSGLLEDIRISEPFCNVEQHPTWIPHVTLGYPETPRLADYSGEAITFDRLALWFGEDRTAVYPLGGTPVAEKESLTAAAPVEELPEVDPAIQAEVAEESEAIEWLLDQEYPEVPWHSIITVEGSASEDNRMFSDGALDSRNLPLSIKAQFSDEPGHDGSVVVGRMDRIFRDGNLIKAEGVFDTSPQAYEALRMVAGGFWRGVSVDVAAVEGAYTEGEEGQRGMSEYTKARIASVTLCVIPAFAEAYIALGTWADAEAEAAVRTAKTPDTSKPQAEPIEGEQKFEVIVPSKTKDGPGWITEPKATKDITGYWVDGRGAAKIGWGAPGDFNRCRVQLAKYVQNPEWLAGLCANLHYRALGIWPGHGAGKASELSSSTSITASGMTIMESATAKVSVDYFVNPMLDGPTPFTVTETGHVFGHIATFDTCHIGFKDKCILAPRSSTDYSYFLTGRVLTDAGPVAVGQITMGGGHADGTLSMKATIAHYDNTTMPVADVTVGEDEFGIWASGKLRDDVTAKEVHELRAAAISGDWRGVVVGGEENLELVAALAVNVPGFPIPRTQFAIDEGRQLSLTAAGIPVSEGTRLTPEFRAQMEAYAADKDRMARAASLRENIRAFRAAEVKSKISSTVEEN